METAQYELGRTPVLSEKFDSNDVMFYHALHEAADIFDLEKGDNVVMTAGQMAGVVGGTNTIKVGTV